MKQDDALNELLLKREKPEAPAGLASKIIAEATKVPEHANKPASIWQVFSQLALPKPAYAVAFTLLLGVVVGWQEPLSEEQDIDEMEAVIFFEEQDLL